MTYSLAGDDLIIIDHTEVDPSLRRTGVRSLVAAAVTWRQRTPHHAPLFLCPLGLD